MASFKVVGGKIGTQFDTPSSCGCHGDESLAVLVLARNRKLCSKGRVGM